VTPTTTTFEQAIPTTYPAGYAVSFSQNGTLQVGGGISLYNQINTLNSSNDNQIQAYCPSYLSMDAVANDFYLISYGKKTTQSSTLTTVKIDSTSTGYQSSVSVTLPTKYFIYETIVLSQDSGLFVSICQDYSVSNATAFLIPGHVNIQTGAIVLHDEEKVLYSNTEYSLGPDLVRLSDTSFALAYYDWGSYNNVVTRYGKSLQHETTEC